MSKLVHQLLHLSSIEQPDLCQMFSDPVSVDDIVSEGSGFHRSVNFWQLIMFPVSRNEVQKLPAFFCAKEIIKNLVA